MRPHGLPGGSDQQDRVQRPRLLQGSCGGCGNNDDGDDQNIRLIVILMYTVKIRKILCGTQVKHIPNTNLISSTLKSLALILFFHYFLFKRSISFQGWNLGTFCCQDFDAEGDNAKKRLVFVFMMCCKVF